MQPFDAAWKLLKEDEEDDYQPGPDGLSEYDKANMDEHGNLPNSAAYHGVSDEEVERFYEEANRAEAHDRYRDKHYAGQSEFEEALPTIRMGDEPASVDEYNLPNEMALWEQSMQDSKLASEPFDRAWALLKQLPDSIVPIGRHAGHDIAMLHGRPMYTSTATAKDSEGNTKNLGQFYDFAGIEPDGSKWDSKLSGGQPWYVKGSGHKDIPKHARLGDVSQNTMQNQMLQHHLQDYDFEELGDIQEVNRRLFDAGYDLSHLKGNYNMSSATPQPAAMSQPSMDTQVMPNTDLARNLAPTIIKPYSPQT